MALAAVMPHTCWLCGPLEQHPMASPAAADASVLAVEPCPWGVIEFQIMTPECRFLCLSWGFPDASAELGIVVWRVKTEIYKLPQGICGS